MYYHVMYICNVLQNIFFTDRNMFTSVKILFLSTTKVKKETISASTGNKVMAELGHTLFTLCIKADIEILLPVWIFISKAKADICPTFLPLSPSCQSAYSSYLLITRVKLY